MEKYFIRFTYAWQRKGITSITMQSETYVIMHINDILNIPELKKSILTEIEKTKHDIHIYLYVNDILFVNKL